MAQQGMTDMSPVQTRLPSVVQGYCAPTVVPGLGRELQRKRRGERACSHLSSTPAGGIVGGMCNVCWAALVVWFPASLALWTQNIISLVGKQAELYQLVMAGFTSSPEPESWRGPGLCTLALGERQRSRWVILFFARIFTPNSSQWTRGLLRCTFGLANGSWLLSVPMWCSTVLESVVGVRLEQSIHHWTNTDREEGKTWLVPFNQVISSNVFFLEFSYFCDVELICVWTFLEQQWKFPLT